MLRIITHSVNIVDFHIMAACLMYAGCVQQSDCVRAPMYGHSAFRTAGCCCESHKVTET